jgi:hypothetical protein
MYTLNTVEPIENMLKKTGKRNSKYVSRVKPIHIESPIIAIMRIPKLAYSK